MTTAANIRRLFLEPTPSYFPPHAAALLGMTSADLRGWVEAGELEGEQTKDGLVLPWAELVSFAMSFWDQEEIEAALGDDLATAIPELLRLGGLHRRIPRVGGGGLRHVGGAGGEA